MPLSPLYVGIHFYLPQTSEASHTRAPAHVSYMVAPKKEELVLSPGEDPAHHTRYMVKRPGSAGLFGPDLNNPPQLSATLSEVSHHAGPVWRLIVSVTEKDARLLTVGAHNLLSRFAWETGARQAMLPITEELDLDQVMWAAAMHRKAGHPHIHLVFWEPSAKRQRGKLSKGEHASVRKAWMRALYGARRQVLQQEKHAVREEIRALSRELPSSGILSDVQRKILTQDIAEIANKSPPRGRLAWAYLPSPAKASVEQTAQWILDTVPAIHEKAQRFMDLAEELARHHSTQDIRHRQARLHARQDLIQRMTPLLLKTARDWDRWQRQSLERALITQFPLPQDASTQAAVAQCHEMLHRMLLASKDQQRQMAHAAMQTFIQMTGMSLSQRLLEHGETVLIRAARAAQRELAQMTWGMMDSLVEGLLADVAEWEQVVRWSQDRRQMAMRRKAKGVLR